MNTSLPRAAALIAAMTLALLMVPATAMLFTAEVRWGIEDFAIAALLLFGAGMTHALAARRTRTTKQRVAVAFLLAAALALVWAELAIGLLS
jgi:hypothetical protein